MAIPAWFSYFFIFLLSLSSLREVRELIVRRKLREKVQKKIMELVSSASTLQNTEEMLREYITEVSLTWLDHQLSDENCVEEEEKVVAGGRALSALALEAARAKEKKEAG